MEQQYEIQWLVPNQVILARLWGVLSSASVETWTEDLVRHLDEGNNTVHLIMEDSEVEKGPPLADSVKLSQTLRHPKMGNVIVIGKDTNRVTQFMTALVTQVLRIQFHRVRTLSDAIQRCKLMDPKINWNALSEVVVHIQARE